MFFTIFRRAIFNLNPNHYQSNLNRPPRVTVTLDMDADVLEWFKAQPTEWLRELNNLARFFMETSQAREAEFAPDAWEPGEMQPPPTAAP